MSDTTPTGAPASEPTEEPRAKPAAPPGEPGVTGPQVSAAPEPPQVALASPGRGQRRIVRETHTTTSRSQTETTTHETSTTVEDVAVVAPVYAAPATQHPRPVG